MTAILLMMKPKIHVLFFTIFLTGCISCQNKNISEDPANAASNEETEIAFKDYEYDFGKIMEGEKVAHIFAFQNKGPGRLVISSAATSCGCTVPRYDKNPIAPGEWGNLEVVFNSSGRTGIQTKTITVRSNANTRVVILKITAEVISD